MTLTDRQIRAAQVPEDLNQVELRDDQVRGLLLRVYRTGGEDLDARLPPPGG